MIFFLVVVLMNDDDDDENDDVESCGIVCLVTYRMNVIDNEICACNNIVVQS